MRARHQWAVGSGVRLGSFAAPAQRVVRTVERLRPVGHGAIAAAVLLAFSVSAFGQVPTDSLPEAFQRLHAGQRVEVTGHDGSVVRGSVMRLSPDGLVLAVEGQPMDRPARLIAAIDRRGDTLLDGATAGGLVGVAAALGLSLLFAGSESGEGLVDRMRYFVPIGVPCGAGIGLLFDAIFEGKTPVYRAAAPRLALAPIITPTHTGIALRVRF